MRDKLAHLNPQDRKKALDLVKQMIPKHNMKVLKHQEEMTTNVTASSSSVIASF